MKQRMKKSFINVCTSSQINAPREITEEELIEIVKSEDPGRYRVPISLGEPVADLDKRIFHLFHLHSNSFLSL